MRYDPVSLHKYLYANANPVMNIDPSGNFMETLAAAAGGSILASMSFIAVGALYAAVLGAAISGIDFILGAEDKDLTGKNLVKAIKEGFFSGLLIGVIISSLILFAQISAIATALLFGCQVIGVAFAGFAVGFSLGEGKISQALFRAVLLFVCVTDAIKAARSITSEFVAKLKQELTALGKKVGGEIARIYNDNSGMADLDALFGKKRSSNVYRGMTNNNGVPEIGNSARRLGVRPNVDIPVDAEGIVHPNSGGMSVAPSPTDLPIHRRPPSFGGTGKDPVWSIDINNLGPDLKYVPDSPQHGTIQPSRSMTLEEYQRALSDTLDMWGIQ